MEFIRRKALFTGDWDHNLNKRRSRVSGILRKIAETFEPAKAQGSGSSRENLDSELERQLKRAKNQFPLPFFLDGVLITPEDVGVMRYCTWYKVIYAPNPDKSVPRNSHEALWNELHDQGKVRTRFDKKRWQYIRQAMEAAREVEVFDPIYGINKAMRWRIGQSFHFAGQGLTNRAKPDLTAAQRLQRDKFAEQVSGEFLTRSGSEAEREEKDIMLLMGESNSSKSLGFSQNCLIDRNHALPPPD